MNLIGLAGPKGSGKSTVARVLVEKHGFTEMAFADPAKKAVAAIFGFSKEDLWGPSERRESAVAEGFEDARYCPKCRMPVGPEQRKVLPKYEAGVMCCQTENCHLFDVPACTLRLTPRLALQSLVTEWGRNMVHPDIWVRAMERHLRYLHGHWEGSPFPAPAFVLSDIRFPNEAALVSRLGGRVWHIERPGFGWSGEHASELGPGFESGDTKIVNDGSADTLAKKAEKGLQDNV